MRTGKFFLQLSFYLLVAVFISCKDQGADKQEKTKIANDASLEKSLKETNRIIEEAIYKSDYETLLKYYTEDVILVPNFQPVLRGKSAVRENYMKQAKAGIKIHSFRANPEKIWSGGNEVYDYGSFGFSVSSFETKHPYAYTGSYFIIREKQPNNFFLIKYFISNLDFNPCKEMY
ncbi:MAG: hypothetical protein A2499_18750 [Stygiobacter sp. RIFOXYC12_FULL_38_8]|nr:MAG: hypothetical protein A2X62_03340 [Stygiobacter sp. GWC2_38_9]OGV09695.1 MAG: hypothetical protein A2299_14190 [Stygiobacter sp. RIFOXYB2_FULL_37_11]OGV11163.1 MAG: hypothetical protein A2237_02715 [Stygiobacter sp. RIFOXYA2_FULL_38_8]OGV13562.1 MAG: hypothetical protein A2440_10325 [Stygiobacter sp. RIFOXYC2_FULL_38_25]OGV26673.1 MAG: hypothetical protein A2499_18750 [Stygiobacter sp. RIFOXYC12_FULL_38_8]OGV79482.1 MAG: hypothetical protein A2X65_01375 [Stygiobacter sp. GWF2_38_21]RJQ